MNISNPKIKKIFFLIFILISLNFINACGSKSPEFSSKEALIQKTVELLNSGNADSLLKTIVSKNEFIKYYYPYMPEAKQKNALPGNDFYKYFIGLQKASAVRYKIKQYKDRILKVKDIGNPEQIIQTDEFKVLRNIPLTLIVKDDDGNEIEIVDNKIIGALVEQNNTYKLMNIFK